MTNIEKLTDEHAAALRLRAIQVASADFESMIAAQVSAGADITNLVAYAIFEDNPEDLDGLVVRDRRGLIDEFRDNFGNATAYLAADVLCMRPAGGDMWAVVIGAGGVSVVPYTTQTHPLRIGPEEANALGGAA